VTSKRNKGTTRGCGFAVPARAQRRFIYSQLVRFPPRLPARARARAIAATLSTVKGGIIDAAISPPRRRPSRPSRAEFPCARATSNRISGSVAARVTSFHI
jgi:hypothetical protein